MGCKVGTKIVMRQCCTGTTLPYYVDVYTQICKKNKSTEMGYSILFGCFCNKNALKIFCRDEYFSIFALPLKKGSRGESSDLIP